MTAPSARRRVVVLAPMPLEMNAITTAFGLTRTKPTKGAPWTGHVGNSGVTAIHIGMASARPEFDAAGTWVAASYVRATARDFARFGLLYLRDGVWDGARLLPEGWVDYGRTIKSVDPEDGPYGAHWWGVAGDTLGTFRASGYEGQSITICPEFDLVVVRLGKTPLERKANLVPWRAAMVEAFARAR